MKCYAKGAGGGFSLAELLLAVALFAIAILAILALSISVLRASRKSVDTTGGTLVAQRLMDELTDQVKANQTASFWTTDYIVSPYATGDVMDNSTDYQYAVYAQTVVYAPTSADAGTPIGQNAAVPNNTLKKVDVVVTWWGTSKNGRAGYGDKLKAQVTRLITQEAN